MGRGCSGKGSGQKEGRKKLSSGRQKKSITFVIAKTIRQQRKVGEAIVEASVPNGAELVTVRDIY